MEVIGLIAALPSESKALLAKIGNYSQHKIGRLKGAEFRVGNHECILFTSGMGIKRAETAAEILIQKYHPACLISFGIAGAARPDLQIGDVVMAARNFLFDKDSVGPAFPLAALSIGTWKSLHALLEVKQIGAYIGTAITTRGSQSVADLQECPYSILEMETAGILRASRQSGTPLFVLRSISDSPNDSIPFDIEKTIDTNGNLRIGKLLYSLIRHPRLLLKIRRLLRNSQIAAEHAALAVLAVLQQPKVLPEEDSG